MDHVINHTAACNYFKVALQDDKTVSSIVLPESMDFTVDDIKLLFDALYKYQGSYVSGNVIQGYTGRKCYIAQTNQQSPYDSCSQPCSLKVNQLYKLAMSAEYFQCDKMLKDINNIFYNSLNGIIKPDDKATIFEFAQQFKFRHTLLTSIESLKNDDVVSVLRQVFKV